MSQRRRDEDEMAAGHFAAARRRVEITRRFETQTTETMMLLCQLVVLLQLGRSVLVAFGAGASVAAGIPAFRGSAQSVFERARGDGETAEEAGQRVFSKERFDEDPRPLLRTLAQLELWKRTPTAWHRCALAFERLGLLRRLYTSNIDELERKVGISQRLVIEAHGRFGKWTCLACDRSFYITNESPTEPRACPARRCKGALRPGIVLYGEQLDARFYSSHRNDRSTANIVLIVGSSMKVAPWNSLASGLSTNQLLIAVDANPTEELMELLTKHQKKGGTAWLLRESAEPVAEQLLCKLKKWRPELVD